MKNNKPVQAENPDFVDFAVTARKYKTLLTKKFLSRKKWENPSPYEIFSSIPGTVVDIYVKEGDVVEEGAPLMTLEAMKMQNEIQSPKDGKIKTINIKENQSVIEGEDLIVIE